MAMINEILGDQFRIPTDLGSVVMDLDHGLSTVAVSVRMMRDMLLHGSPGTGTSRCDPEEAAAVAEALMAHLGHLGHLLDRLDVMTGDGSFQAEKA